MTTRFYFDTGVRPDDFNPPLTPGKGQVIRGTIQIPFDCDDVPKGAAFRFASDCLELANESLLAREIKNSILVSKYAFFALDNQS